MLKVLKKDGFASFVEVVVTAVMFTIAAFGIFTSISILRPQGKDAERRLQAAYVGKGVIDELYGLVDASTWDVAGNPLEPDIYHTETVGNYLVNYILTDVAGLGIRELNMTVNYIGP